MQEFITIPTYLIREFSGDKPYSKLEAYIDILNMADENGEVSTTRRELMSRWGWSSSKVISFLSMLEEKNIIEPKKNQKRTTIKLVNASVSEFLETKKEPKKNQKRTKEIMKITVKSSDALRMVLNEWNELSLYGIEQIPETKISSVQYQNLKNIANKYGVSDILESINKIKDSSFLQGGKTNFRITFDWFLVQSNYEKVRSGKYDDSKWQSSVGNSYIDAIRNRVSEVDNW